MKTAIVIPGFREQVQSGPLSWRYQPLLNDLKEAGYTVKIIVPPWQRRTIFEWLDEIDTRMKGIDARQTVVIGFSFGAMIAAGLAARHRFKKAILCSLSPYWAEDIPNAKPWWLKTVGTRRVGAFKKYSFKDITKNYKASSTLVLLGSREAKNRKAPIMFQRSQAAGRQLPNTRFELVPSAGHNIAQPNYRQRIKREL